MSAKKKITDQIAEDMRNRYGSGDYTQGELADIFKVSVPTVNKVVKGVKPVKRKYTHRDNKYVERNAEIVRLYNEGNKTREIAEKFDMTHQNVSLVLQANGVNPQKRYFEKLQEQKAARVAAEADAREEKVQAKKAKVRQLSHLWRDGCTVEEFRVAAGLKSVGAAQVKVVNLRKKFGVHKFPKRDRNTLTPEQKAERDTKAEALSKLWIEGAPNETMAEVFGWKPEAVVRRIPKFRKTYGEDKFPYRRRPTKKGVEKLEQELEVTDGSVEVAPDVVVEEPEVSVNS